MIMKRILFLILIALSFAACKTNLVYINVMEPAPVSIPAYIKKVGIINRSLTSEENKKTDAIDKVLSMEGIELDKEGSKESIRGLGDELIKNNRFTEVKTLDNVNLRTTGSGVFPSSLAWETVEKICRDNNVDALFALELFDTDSKISYTSIPVTVETPLGKVPAIEHQASMLTMVNTGWRIYDNKGRNILDQFSISKSLTFTGKGINPVVAASALIGRREAVKQVGNEAGRIYAERIIPYWIRVSRKYYVKGNNSFENATRKARTGNWDGAAELWKKETTNSNNKLAGRACYNMAIISEINGSIDMAIQWAQKAYEDYNNHLALEYVNALKKRKDKDNRLKKQLEE